MRTINKKFEPNPSFLSFYLILGGSTPPFLPKIKFWLRGVKFFYPQSHSFNGLRLPWKFEPNPSWLNFCLIWGARPPFLPKIEFVLGGGAFSPPITIFYRPKFSLKVWAKSEMVEFLPNLGCPPPPSILPKIKFWLNWGGGIFTSNHNLLLVSGYHEILSQIQVGWIFA